MGPGPHVTLQFVTYAGDPNSAATKAAKNAVVRRHAANAVHGRVRRERVLQYQQQQQRQRELEEAPSQQSAARNPGGDEAEVLSPFSYLSPCHVDPFHTGARPLSELESFLLNHYTFDVLSKSATRCSSQLPLLPHYVAQMRQVLLPLALSDTGLLAAVLLSACRSLEGRHGKMEARTRTATANSCRWSSEVARWRIAGWRYKGEAIAQVRDRVGDEGENVSEETVAIVLMLAADEIVGGDVNALRQHAAAVGRIVKLRGGLENMGFSNFMKQLIAWFLENPERRDVPCLLPAIDAADRVSATEMMAMSAAGVLVSDQARPGFSYETTSS